MLKDITSYTKYIGEKFGLLTINNIRPKFMSSRKIPRNIYLAECNCKCGNNKDIEITAILRGSTRSCGCKRDQYEKTRGKNNVNYTGYEDISGRYFSKLKRGAKKRNLEFNITLKDIWNQYLKQDKKCALCGIELLWDKKAEFKCSVDRIDSKKGYTKDNIQIIDYKINTMKMDLKESDFIYLCKLISRHRTGTYDTNYQGKCA